MDPITVIVTALIAGAAAGGSDAAAAAVRDAYAAIRNRLSQAGRDAETTAAIEANEAAPGENVAAIEAAVTRTGLGSDQEAGAAASRLLANLSSDRIEQAKSLIDLSHAQGVQVGDHNTQNNTFN